MTKSNSMHRVALGWESLHMPLLAFLLDSASLQLYVLGELKRISVSIAYTSSTFAVTLLKYIDPILDTARRMWRLRDVPPSGNLCMLALQILPCRRIILTYTLDVKMQHLTACCYDPIRRRSGDGGQHFEGSYGTVEGSELGNHAAVT
ncbi:hypothetical protein GMOD_00000012 [Pyrenophora seminiperda CCB06]|uniref:Uncharacterized protein n=1 Tax=Pyrenophora seminiperda CCB06 TaxID=1302712 RepID=A0A3M7M6F6_9PLEO|nr:hypothetical protein GMOD_00000012 [Pyrenophora seminiperda CCB06]